VTSRRPDRLALALVLTVLLGLAAVGSTGRVQASTGAGVPPIPLGTDGRFLTNLSSPVLPPSGVGQITFDLEDPLPSALTAVTVVLEIYAYVPSLGAPAQAVPQGAVEFGTGVASPGSASASGGSIEMNLSAVEPGSHESIGAQVLAASGADLGSYLVRTALEFTSNGSSYRFESEGYFAPATWAEATNRSSLGGPGVNLTLLGVDGITPDTAIGLAQDPYTVPIYALAGGGILLAGAGAYLYFRTGPGSRSGAAAGAAPQSAPKAVGK
jgi:hypothetical protein